MIVCTATCHHGSSPLLLRGPIATLVPSKLSIEHCRLLSQELQERNRRATERQGDYKDKVKDQKGKGVANGDSCGKPGHLARDCWRSCLRQVASDPVRSSSGRASVTTHTAGQQHARVSQQGSSAETKPVVRRIENNEPMIFDLGEGHDGSESHGV